ncbi:ribonuclease H-like YkuK family protein [Paenibacillus hexagrammi]|uniref:Ribonuclease H-like YkuK family protein n=1 Tax=Paenibacillus hexagrammi TaxID=2908839 RepID=A0ABY3SQA5_9BACL|nr:ribonuclease H-like YkuK family protein [Paenibacillus sp. YPD9-1]UJF35424.1 ribonuclease H-like YkuK family protein [Paenibacillus sp. YPD9-1]
MEFRNTTEQGLTIDDVHHRILRFMRLDPTGTYRFIIGTDCQVHAGYTKFISGIVIQRMGKGAWACYRQVFIPRALRSVREKLSTETALSEEIAMYISEDKRKEMEDIVVPYIYKGASIDMFIHIDAGADVLRNKTAPFVDEMMRRVESVGMVPVIKPDCYAASSYANRYTKKPTPLRKHISSQEVADGSL